VSEHYGLDAEESEAVRIELMNEVPADGSLTAVGIAEPGAIAERLVWLIDGEVAEVDRLFFEVERGGCTQPSEGVFALPELEWAADPDGFEVGIVQ
jgi:hypothetical protein